MANSTASYDQLVYQVEALRQENSHLRRELEDNSNHLSKLENETTDMKVREGKGMTLGLWGK
jgi:adenomatosis polyposis coli protein